MTLIIGAGLSGLIAANLIPGSRIIESGSKDHRAHKALLRFRSSAVGDALGINFRKVTVRKGLYDADASEFVQPNIRLANMYAKKVIGRIVDRSIWNLDTAERFIAPEDLAAQLVERLGSRIDWNTPAGSGMVDRRDRAKLPIISTAPMSVNLSLCGIGHEKVIFQRAPVVVRRWRVHNCDVHQTVYYPEYASALYRASITGDLLIAEYVADHYDAQNESLDLIRGSFNIAFDTLEKIDTTEQKYGKIAAIDNDSRKRWIRHMTLKHNVYSLGRFATWRNILLDDVLNDVYVIKKLLHANEYDAARIAL